MPAVREMPVRRCRPSEDVVPFSECRNNLSHYITRVRETHRPVLITQNGRAASYLVDAESLDELLDRIELSHDIEISRREFAEGKGIPQDVVFNRLHEKLLAMKHAEALS
ncbi:MAG: type II toxin-antitoxin system Phd/YefM family antitoxin [Kiritimatiellae bacterium]|nr:type II toxin-antitoxin system Phd/YefM family antitoxin [Kiritimatiellia bacterium]